MPAQYAQLDGRHWCNEDFVNKVRDLYPATTKKIPLGYSTYTGWTGKDEILFTSHEHLDDEAQFEGNLYEASFDDVGATNFRDKILEQVDHQSPRKRPRDASERQRKQADLDQRWGQTLDDKMKVAALEKQARRGLGLYGYPKPIQSSCETAVKRINRRATALMHKAIKKDRNLVAFLQTHATRGQSSAARVLLAAYKASMPQTDWDDEKEDESAEFDFGIQLTAAEKEAAPKWGMYGYPRKTASLGLSACTAVREAAGYAASDLHRRKAALYARVTGFLGEHSKVGKSHAAGLILACYPVEGFVFRRRASEKAPTTVGAWLDWDPDQG
jgi:hypothetical protein